jgi:hypothetical protein
MSEFIIKLFEYECCEECGGDENDHTEILVLGEPFALCNRTEEGI